MPFCVFEDHLGIKYFTSLIGWKFLFLVAGSMVFLFGFAKLEIIVKYMPSLNVSGFKYQQRYFRNQ